MKNIQIIFFIGVVLFTTFSTQNANAQNANIAQRIIGTWVEPEGETWVFNTNGTLITLGTNEWKFAVTDTKLAYLRKTSSCTYIMIICDISISSDGKTIILTNGLTNDGRNIARVWLTKR